MTDSLLVDPHFTSLINTQEKTACIFDDASHSVDGVVALEISGVSVATVRITAKASINIANHSAWNITDIEGDFKMMDGDIYMHDFHGFENDQKFYNYHKEKNGTPYEGTIYAWEYV